jgi:hypothetical protein
MPNIGDRCTGHHGNAERCTWDGEKWTRTDGVEPCPYDQSNHVTPPSTN